MPEEVLERTAVGSEWDLSSGSAPFLLQHLPEESNPGVWESPCASRPLDSDGRQSSKGGWVFLFALERFVPWGLSALLGASCVRRT